MTYLKILLARNVVLEETLGGLVLRRVQTVVRIRLIFVHLKWALGVLGELSKGGVVLMVFEIPLAYLPKRRVNHFTLNILSIRALHMI